jgi:phosphohistidine phosphatase
MLLYLVRHAWAGEADQSQWPDDSLRPLTDEGRKRFDQVAKALASRGVAPELVATSPLVRCRQTAEILVKRVVSRPKLVDVPALAPGGDLEQIIAWTEREAADLAKVAWVGHNPDVEDYLADLLGGENLRVRFTKGAVAALEFPGPPARGQGELRWLVTAKMLGC